MHEDPPAASTPERDAGAVAPDAGVSFVMPVLNEEAYLARAVESVLAQAVPGPSELVLALGPSTDATDRIAHALAESDDRITIVANPAADIPIGLNLAIRASRYPTVIRVDAHSDLDPGYAARALRTLDRTQAANVGGTMHAEGRTAFQQAVAAAYNSPVGLGGGAYHGSGEEGPAESAYLGVMRRSVLEEVGLFDESIRRGEDWELNLRIRQAGYRVWFDPSLSVTYWPRERWSRLARQFFATGTWRAELVRRFGSRNSVRFFAPPALLFALAAALVLLVLQLTGAVSGALALILSVLHLPAIAYLLVVALTALRVRGSARTKLWWLIVLPTMHVTWGAGFLVGMLRGAGHSVDTSRLEGRNTPLP